MGSEDFSARRIDPMNAANNPNEFQELKLNPDWMIIDSDPFMRNAIVGLFLAFMIGLLISAFLPDFYRRAYSVDVNLARNVPVAEPLILQQVSRDTAKQINDATPMTTKLIEPAKPFLFFGKPDDLARATDCLAATIYYEAGAEPPAGQLAVAQVVLNRVRHPGYPNTVCGVVFQGHERRTGCQFSYTCDGSMVRRRPSPGAWANAQRLSRAMLNGLVYPPVGLATHYHTDWVLPKWSAKLDKVRVERTHLFFRYFGFWGTPKAFSARYSGIETQFGKLGLLSPQHRNSETDNMQNIIETAAKESADADADLPSEEIKDAGTKEKETDATMGGFLTAAPENSAMLRLQIDPMLDGDTLPSLAIRACGDRAICKVEAWTEDGLIRDSTALIRQGQGQTGLAFTFTRKFAGKAGKAKWNCALFPRANMADCL
jgi:hypothetical protein